MTIAHRQYALASTVEEFLASDTTRKFWDILFVDWTKNTVYMKGKDFVKASDMVSATANAKKPLMQSPPLPAEVMGEL